MNHKRLLLIFVALLGAILACNAPTSSSPDNGNLPSETLAAPLKVDTATPQGQMATLTTTPLPPPPTATPSIPTDTQPAPPSDTVPAPTETQSILPPVPSIYFPSGFMTSAGDGASIIIYDLQGKTVAQLQTPGISGGAPANLHMAGGVWNGAINGALVYVSFEDQGKIKQNFNGQISDLIPGPDIANLNGAVGQNIFIYSDVWLANETLASQLYVYNGTTGSFSLVHEWWDPDFTALFPLGIRTSENEAQEIWYTYQPWGIGGDIVFPPNEGLLHLDLNTGNETLLLALGFNPVGLSPDKSTVAYVPVSLSYLDEPNPSLKLYNLSSGTITEILLLPGSERGAGYATFSPNNGYVAWMEASGWQMAEVPNFTSRVRIADLNGNTLADLPVSALASVTNVTNPSWARPAGWLDAETLIVEILGDNWNNAALVTVRYDGSNPAYLAPGRFAGFVYP